MTLAQAAKNVFLVIDFSSLNSRTLRFSGRDPLAVTLTRVHTHHSSFLLDKANHFAHGPAAGGVFEAEAASSQRREASLNLRARARRIDHDQAPVQFDDLRIA